ncbi:TPA: methionyl-tRNA formyltransferase [Candidatus Campbellbacteria bacterium]|nr:MAG: methionyl-tRNA formyltransferase, methionyl-tRNA formyltransferase [Candidatus Campbellbacteria bacterium GW2011_OD1_34_28]KKP74835.1 MAG: Methionyl-tRNA formyltransferase [Candidatus Campbellbacteria bacterium GW2011_GWD2_35_24]KKP75721.1 MAG: methionyl-tRNA formyltransferase, methionyl-tRNA formyltransferase [Candidatus Campbellbacteria bacterium GW2011_GWC2_35_28]KKP77031.1 MAG: Methionyl-tRNA formyltransferase [Candidatus Campbellbacteria bacterium GW2011_GWC1_35_31]KKP78957.1 MAG: 
MVNLKIAFFGTPEFSARILDKMKEGEFSPSLIIATPDKPKGRNLVMTPPSTKIWAEQNNIDVLQPTKLKAPEFLDELKKTDWDLFVVASYGKIIPQDVLDIPKYGTINIHPSLLPRLRGASPMQSAILKENETGMTIMLMDADMDHGPILKQEKLDIKKWPPKINELEDMMVEVGGRLLNEVIPLWISGKIKPKEQDHNKATYIDKINKEEALINFDDDPFWNYRKIQALQNYKPYFFTERNDKKIRIIIKEAKFEDGELIIMKVLPEGKKEMDYQDFLRGSNNKV